MTDTKPTRKTTPAPAAGAPPDTATDTAPGALPLPDAEIPGFEPPVPGESSREKRARNARNRRKAERVQKDAAAAAGAEPPKAGRPSKQAKRAASVTMLATVAGTGVAAMFDPVDGMAIIEGAPALGDSLAKVAESNPRVAKALDSLTESSGWFEVAAAVAGIVMPIVRNHLPTRTDDQADANDPPAPSTSTTSPPSPAPTVKPTPDGGYVFTAEPAADRDAPPVFTAIQ